MSSAPFRRVVPTAFLLAALAGCSRSDAAADAAPEAGVAQALAPARDPVNGPVMSASKACGSTAIERSACMIELILSDLKANYPEIGGGGITRIEAGAVLSYSVALPQEERTDIFTYEFEARGDRIGIKTKTGSTESY